MKNYKLVKFSIAFINEVDKLLKDTYSKLPREKFFLFYSIIERQSASHPKKAFRNTKARLKASYISKFLGSRYYKQIIDISIEKGIIQRDNHYIIKEKSFDYWISLSFNDKVSIEELTTQEEIITNDSKLYTKIKKSFARTSFDRKYWNVFSLLNQIEFNEPAAIKWLSKLVIDGYFDENDEFNQHKYNVYQRMINDMVEKKWVIVEDGNTKRLFHTFNLIKRELRGFCYVNGESLVQSDLRSSQPYFLASRLLKIKPNNENIISFFNDVTEKDIYQVLLDEYIKLNGNNSYTKIKLKRKNGKVIKRIEETSYFDNRDDIKPEFLKVMYKGRQGGATLLNVFKTRYPAVYNEINNLKLNNKNELPLTLQKDEANIFISVFKKLSKEEWCLSVHDSIYTTKSNRSIMIDYIKDKFNELGYIKYRLV